MACCSRPESCSFDVAIVFLEKISHATAQRRKGKAMVLLCAVAPLREKFIARLRLIPDVQRAHEFFPTFAARGSARCDLQIPKSPAAYHPAPTPKTKQSPRAAV